MLYILITKWSPDTAPLALKAMILFTPSCLPAEQSEGLEADAACAQLLHVWGMSGHHQMMTVIIALTIKEGRDDTHTLVCKICSLIDHLTPLSISYILRLFYTFIVEADLCSDECLLQCISPMVQQM